VPAHKRRDKSTHQPAEQPLPGTAGMAQGQPAAGVEPRQEPEQADGPVTGAEAIEVQQKDPDLDDSSGARP
jgi:hypothetical protein